MSMYRKERKYCIHMKPSNQPANYNPKVYLWWLMLPTSPFPQYAYKIMKLPGVEKIPEQETFDNRYLQYSGQKMRNIRVKQVKDVKYRVEQV